MTSSNEMIDKNGVKYWELWGIRLFSRGEDDVLSLVKTSLESRNKNYWIATVNPEFLMEAEKDKDFKAILERTNLNVVDGIGLIWAREVLSEKSGVARLGKGFLAGVKILAGGLRENLVAGADLVDKCCRLASETGRTVYFFGGWDERSKQTADYFVNKYPNLKVIGCRAEDFDLATKTDFLFVARAMKKQEEWIAANYDKLNCGVVMGVGRTFDYYSGKLKRAPEFLRRIGLEWLYSLYKEPKRWKRQLVLPRFIGKVLAGN